MGQQLKMLGQLSKIPGQQIVTFKTCSAKLAVKNTYHEFLPAGVFTVSRNTKVSIVQSEARFQKSN